MKRTVQRRSRVHKIIELQNRGILCICINVRDQMGIWLKDLVHAQMKRGCSYMPVLMALK